MVVPRADVVSHDEKHLRVKRARFDSRATLLKLVFASVDEC